MKRQYFTLSLLFISILILFSACMPKVELPGWLEGAVSYFDNQNDEEVAGESMTCDDLEFSKVKGMPLSDVTINGFPKGIGQYLAIEVSNQDKSVTSYIPVEKNGSDAGFIVPAHPEGDVSGGDVVMRLTDEHDAYCQEITFTIEAMPVVAGAFKEMNELIIQGFELQKQIINLDQEGLGGFSEDSTDLNNAVNLVEDLLTGEDNPNAIEKVVNKDAEITEVLTDSEWDLLDALVAESGAVQMLEEYVDKLGQAPSDLVKDSSHLTTCLEDGFDAETLSELMWLQVTSQIRDEVAQETGYLSTASTLLNGSNLLLMGTTGGVPNKASMGAAVLAESVSAWELSMGMLSGLLPSKLDKLEYDYEKPLYLEDDEDMVGSWENVLLYTSSEGWDATTKVFEMLMKRMMGGSAKPWLKSKFSTDVTDEVASVLEGMFSSSAVQASNSLTGGPKGIFQVPPCDFGGTDISDEAYSRAYFEDSFNAPAEIINHGEFQLKQVGKDNLVVEAIAEKFALKTISQAEPVEVKEIKVSMSPEVKVVEPGEAVTFDVIVEDANDPSVEISLYPDAGHQMKVERVAEGQYNVHVKTSKNEDHFPLLVTAESISETGLRGLAGAPARVASSEIKLQDSAITISPQSTCLNPDESEQFVATVDHPDYKDVKWSASEGHISSDGLFTAPDVEAGTKIKIRAEAVKNKKIFAESEAVIGDCVCYGSVQMGPSGSMTRMVTEPYKIDPFTTSMGLKKDDDDNMTVATMSFGFGEEGSGLMEEAIKKVDDLSDEDAIKIILGELTERAQKGVNFVAITFDNPPIMGEPGKYKAWISGRFAEYDSWFGHDMNIPDSLYFAVGTPPIFSVEDPQPEVTVEFSTLKNGPEINTFFVEGHIYGPVDYHVLNGEYDQVVGSFEMDFIAYYDHFNNKLSGHACSGTPMD